jgi:hypothetical protein
MLKIDSSNEKAKITVAIKAFLKAKADLEAAEKAKKEAQKTLLEFLDGDEKAEWASDGNDYALSATYGKTRQSLDKSLVEKVFGVVVTSECYRVSSPWNELRIKVVR